MAVGPYCNADDAVNYTASVPIPKFRIVAFDTADKSVKLATAATDKLIGITSDIDALVGEPCDVFRDDIPRVVYGGAVTKGDPLTSDATGRAVVAAAGNRVVGYAEISGVADDIGSCAIFLGKL